MENTKLPHRHLALALLVVAMWGANFVVIRVALEAFPPFLLSTLRFLFTVFPLVFFYPRPKGALLRIAAYGLLIGIGQTALLFFALANGIAPGLASVVMQSQVIFTLLFAWIIQGEHLRLVQIAAIGVSCCGFALIAAHTGGALPAGAFMLTLGAAASWAATNIMSKSIRDENPVGYVAWASLFALPPMALLAIGLEGPAAISAALGNAGPLAWSAALWQSLGNSIMCFSLWCWLLGRHRSSTITPFAMLVPVFAIMISRIVLKENLPIWKVEAVALIVGGLAIPLFAGAKSALR